VSSPEFIFFAFSRERERQREREREVGMLELLVTVNNESDYTVFQKSPPLRLS